MVMKSLQFKGKNFKIFQIMVSVLLPAALFLLAASAQAATVTADVVALDQQFYYNRLGAVNPYGMIYALRRDVVDNTTGLPESAGGVLTQGNVRLRDDKRPRPLVLRVNEGDILKVNFTNLLGLGIGEQPFERKASFHAMGLQLAGSKNSDGSYVGKNVSSLASPGETKVYKFLAEKEGIFLAYSGGAVGGGEGNLGSLPFGLFGSVNVEPADSVWYRSQVTREELDLATKRKLNGDFRLTPQGHPLINYNARYPNAEPYISQGKAGLPILLMKFKGKVIHSDINAIISGKPADNYMLPAGTYPEVHVNAPYAGGPALSDEYRSRNEPFREFSVIFHDEIFARQAFTDFADPVLSHTLHGVRDGFAINYGTGGIGSEILANRRGLGPMADCVECKF